MTKGKYVPLEKYEHSWGRRCHRLSRSDRAYLAGIFDGEGSIGVSSRSPIHHSLSVTVASTSEELIRWIWVMTGVGTISVSSRPPRKAAFYWRCFSRQAASVLEQIGPLLIVKRSQVDPALEFAAGGSETKGRKKLKELIVSMNSGKGEKGEPVYVSHFETCPQASSFSKGKDAGRG